ncbi:MAG: hypothetical protein ACXQS5_01710, partial [Candidatus Methanospirareceae archaeon]
MTLTSITRLQPNGCLKTIVIRRRKTDAELTADYVKQTMLAVKKSQPDKCWVWNAHELEPGILNRDTFLCKACGMLSSHNTANICRSCYTIYVRAKRCGVKVPVGARQSMVESADWWEQRDSYKQSQKDRLTRKAKQAIGAPKLAKVVTKASAYMLMLRGASKTYSLSTEVRKELRRLYANEISKIRNHNSVPYNTYAKQLPLSDEAKTDSTGQLHVKCKTCGSYHVPTMISVTNRIAVLAGQLTYKAQGERRASHGESNFYCSDKCKAMCSTFGLKGLKIIDPDCVHEARSYQSKQKQEKMQSQLDIVGCNFCDNEACSYIGTDLKFHHECLVKDGGEGVTDPRMQSLLCHDCHMEWHHKPGAKETMDLAN